MVMLALATVEVGVFIALMISGLASPGPGGLNLDSFNPGNILTGNADPIDFLILAVAIVIPVAYALIVFPRRDLAAPS